MEIKGPAEVLWLTPSNLLEVSCGLCFGLSVLILCSRHGFRSRQGINLINTLTHVALVFLGLKSKVMILYFDKLKNLSPISSLACALCFLLSLKDRVCQVKVNELLRKTIKKTACHFSLQNRCEAFHIFFGGRVIWTPLMVWVNRDGSLFKLRVDVSQWCFGRKVFKKCLYDILGQSILGEISLVEYISCFLSTPQFLSVWEERGHCCRQWCTVHGHFRLHREKLCRQATWSVIFLYTSSLTALHPSCVPDFQSPLQTPLWVDALS